jgi:hypothetical protein
VARLAGKEKKKGMSTVQVPPTSHPVQSSQGISGIMPWSKKDKDESRWEPGVIGREKARVIIDGSRK